jgi:hypothetical protein
VAVSIGFYGASWCKNLPDIFFNVVLGFKIVR